MPSLDRRRRRRPVTAVLVVVVAVAVVLGLLIGGALRVGRASGPYWADVNRSYATQGIGLVRQSNLTGAQLRRLMADMPHLGRPALQEQLDRLVADSSQAATTAASLSPPTPTDGMGPQFAAVLADRAKAVAQVRAAVDGLLGMAPLPVVGASTTTTTAPQALLPAGRATADIAGAGALLRSADEGYSAVRHQFRSAPGRAVLPPSTWVTDPATWTAASAQALVDQLDSATSLAPRHRVVLLPNGIRLTPPALPPATPPPAGTGTVPPSHHLSVTVVVANRGNVDEPRVTVSVQVQGGPTRSRTVALAAGRSEAVRLPPIRVVPGHSYPLTVSVTPPAGQVATTQTSRAFTIHVAPVGSATTTTS
ncbi:MAG TPA: hypothetical protein VHB02_03505 [Acidimicrobiales bacterium]|nr:hypothetical protein [Acidimicrobiales bacterium]